MQISRLVRITLSWQPKVYGTSAGDVPRFSGVINNSARKLADRRVIVHRRDMSKALFASAGTVLIAKSAQAQTCTPPCYPQTSIEAAQSITPVNMAYPPGNVRRYGALGNGTTDDTQAIRDANRVASISTSAVYFPSGIYLYKPSAKLDIRCKWEGESVNSTTILCDTSAYTGEFFRLVASNEMCDLTVRTVNMTGSHGIGVRISEPDPVAIPPNPAPEPNFTGHVRMTRVWVQGFAVNIQSDRSFMVTLDQVRSEYGGYGFYCEPGSTAPGPIAYITTHVHLNCFYGFNGVNVFYLTPQAMSTSVTFLGGANEGATAPFGANGSSYASYFGNISNLRFINVYCEAQPAAIVISAQGRSATFDGLYLNGTGGVYLGSNVMAKFTNVLTTTSTDVLAGGDGTQNVLIENCSWPVSGNSTAFSSLTVLNSSINGIFHGALLPTLRRGAGSPQGVVVAPVGALYLRTDGAATSTCT